MTRKKKQVFSSDDLQKAIFAEVEASAVPVSFRAIFENLMFKGRASSYLAVRAAALRLVQDGLVDLVGEAKLRKKEAEPVALLSRPTAQLPLPFEGIAV